MKTKMISITVSFIFVMLIATTHSVADNIFMPSEFEEELSVVGDNEVEQLMESSNWLSKRKTSVVSVDSFGAVGDGISDDTQAFLSAWNRACTTHRSVFLVPKGRSYLVKPARFLGPCVDKLIIQINGTIVAPDEPSDWDQKSPNNWLVFSKLNKTIIQGGGVIDGSGSKWWAASCKKNKENPCIAAPTAITIDSSSVVVVEDLTIKNSQQIHFQIYRSKTIRVFRVQISAPGDSPNTDGIHIAESTDIMVQNIKIGTGDDCISIVNGSSIIKMKHIYCGPGHGISIGSLGKDNSKEMVTAVVLDTAVLKNTTNGLRIKTWQGGSGYVRSVRFENVRMNEVENPIIIDQFYCDSPDSCQNQTAAVKISQVMYRNITGTTTSEKAIQLACSDTVPCSNIILSNVNLESKEGTAETYCNSATGSNEGIVNPSADCLDSSNKDSYSDMTTDSNLEDLHAEL
ncbi:hypothetical protein MKX03_030776 [Papaver bracteatum]|nr:hypothetical protein MKX03_030776 [Papaver bracteatum]